MGKGNWQRRCPSSEFWLNDAKSLRDIHFRGHRRVFRKKMWEHFARRGTALTRNFVQFIFVKIGLLLGQFFEALEVMKRERR